MSRDSGDCKRFASPPGEATNRSMIKPMDCDHWRCQVLKPTESTTHKDVSACLIFCVDEKGMVSLNV